ncbi:MAG: hypothetical protein Q4A16_01785 [Lautropia sp.]|nr:hypothetical protein [Lautropia sp.]
MIDRQPATRSTFVFNRPWRILALPVLLGTVLSGCSAIRSAEVPAPEQRARADDETMAARVAAAEREQRAAKPVESKAPSVGASLSDLPPARLPAQSSAACLADIETMAERYSGQRVMLGDKAFVDSSELVLDQVFARDAQGRVLDGRRQGVPEPFVIQLRFGPRGCMAVVPAQAAAIRPVPASAMLPSCRCQPPVDSGNR